MKIIQHIGGVVVDIRNAHDGITIEGIALVESIPTFEPREGFNGVLKYDNGLYWDYEEAPVNDDVTGEEFMDMVQEVL